MLTLFLLGVTDDQGGNIIIARIKEAETGMELIQDGGEIWCCHKIWRYYLMHNQREPEHVEEYIAPIPIRAGREKIAKVWVDVVRLGESWGTTIVR